MEIFSKVILITFPHLHLPIKNDAEKVPMQILVNGEVKREFDVELALVGDRDWWSFYDVSEFIGQTVTLRSLESRFTESQAELLSQLITQSDGLLDDQDLYIERYRPQFHFTPKRGWNNDPNGMVYFNGTWHLFFQYTPFGINWGAMHWGHAVSQDLVHWVEQPIALYPKSMQDMAFSGGGLVDSKNSSGFGSTGDAPMVLSYTSTGRGECLVYSLDGGEQFKEYQGNPVWKHVGRDPKIIWHEETQKWVMIVYEEGEGLKGYDILTSSNLKEWTKQQHLPGWFECPELFELPVEGGEPGEKLWVVYGCIPNELRSAFQLGDFDGETITLYDHPRIGHAGQHFYAAQNFSNAPDGRLIMVGWLAGASYPGMPFGNGMTIPLELSLQRIDQETRLCFYPVKEMEQLRTKTIHGENLSVLEANKLLAELENELIDLELEIETDGESLFRIDIGGYPLIFNPEILEVTFMDQTMTRKPGEELLHLRILIDRSVTEVFVDHGWCAFASMTIFSDFDCRTCMEGTAIVRKVSAHMLASIWDA